MIRTGFGLKFSVGTCYSGWTPQSTCGAAPVKIFANGVRWARACSVADGSHLQMHLTLIKTRSWSEVYNMDRPWFKNCSKPSANKRAELANSIQTERSLFQTPWKLRLERLPSRSHEAVLRYCYRWHRHATLKLTIIVPCQLEKHQVVDQVIRLSAPLSRNELLPVTKIPLARAGGGLNG